MINAASGAKLFIGSTSIPVFANDFDPNDIGDIAAVLAEFEADSYIEVGEVEDMGEFGDESETITFVSMANSRTRKLKGPRDAGTQTIVVGDDMTDEGQIALKAAEQTKFDYNIKLVLNDAITLGGNGSIHYYYGKIMSRRRNIGNASNVVRRNFVIGVNSFPIEVDPT